MRTQVRQVPNSKTQTAPHIPLVKLLSFTHFFILQELKSALKLNYVRTSL